jgi:hypothetical protein
MDGTAGRLVGGKRGRGAGVALALSLAAILLAPATGSAEVVTIGTPTAEFGTGQSSAACNCTQYQVSSPAQVVETVPANGVIVDWRVAGSGTLTLEALHPSGGVLSIVGESGPGEVAASGGSVPAQPVDIPVVAGDSIAVHLSGSNPRVLNDDSPASTIGLAFPDAPITPPSSQTTNGLISLNADVAITPVVTSVTPDTGPTGGTNLVTITGSYLDGATGVDFGTLPAAFTVISPTEITAYAPLQGPGPVDVRVIGQAATSAITPGDQFTYQPKPVSQQSPEPGSGSGSGPGSAPQTGTPILNSPALAISPLSLSASAFFAVPSGSGVKESPIGTTLRYTVSAAATTTFVIEEALPGRLLPATAQAGGDCVALNKATLPEKLPKCTRYVALTPHLTHRGSAGHNVLELTGLLDGRQLAPGAYRLVATARSSSTPVEVSAAVTHAFRILAPKTAKSTATPKAKAAPPKTSSGAVAGPTGPGAVAAPTGSGAVAAPTG